MDNLIKLRKSRNLSQKQLAEKLDIDQTTISGYERNYRQADYQTLQKLATFFDVTIDYLLDSKGSDLIIMTKEQYLKLTKNISQAKQTLHEIDKQNSKNNVRIEDNHGKIFFK